MILRNGIGGRAWVWRRVIMLALAAVSVFLSWYHVGDHADRAAARERPPVASETPRERANIGFVDARRLDEHYDKHGGEFGRITKQDYLHQAQLLRDAAVGGPVLQAVRADGVTTKYDRDTGAFIAFNPNGTIRTFFKPNDGERYYRRQAERTGE